MYSRKHILKAVFFIILASMTVSGYFLKPIDVKVAHYYESLSMYKEAITAYEKSLEATGDQDFQREILVRISILCRYIGDYDNFLATVKRLLDLEYESPELMKDGMDTSLDLWRFKEYLVKLAKVFEIEGDYRTAHDFYKRAYSETKNLEWLESMVSCAYHLDQAVYEEALQESADRNPTEENLFRLASFYLYVIKNYEKANETLENMVYKWPLPKYQVLLSYSFLRINDIRAACDLLKRIPPKFRQSWGTQLLSKHYQEQGEWNKAIDVIKDYIKFYPDDTNTLLCLAYIYKRMNWTDEYQELIQFLLPP